MKKPTIILIALLLLFAGSLMAFYLWYNYRNQQVTKSRFWEQVGVYVLDMNKTDLGGYKKDSNLYKNLTIIFRDDSTFRMNMTVPFIYDSAGRWKAGGAGLEDWNRLYYKSWNYASYGNNAGNQFDQCCLPDSTFYINGATPRNGATYIQEIYFKKVSDH